jgi:esterase/lipase
MFRNFPKLFEDPGITYPLMDKEAHFDEYIAQCKKIVASTRQDLGSNGVKIVEANCPFELYPTKTQPEQKIKSGALLIHGLLDSPFVMRDIGKQMQDQGMLVRSILLPGHGTVPGALLNVDYHKWVKTARQAIRTLTKEVDQIFLVGFSLGAIIAFYETIYDKTKIAGIISFAPAIRIRTRLDFATNFFRLIGKCIKRTAWMNIEEEINYVKYRSIPFNAAYQVYRLTRKIKKSPQKKRLDCPLFFVVSHDDQIVSSDASLKFFTSHKNPLSQMIYYANHPIVMRDERIIVRNSSYPEMNILNFSHICLPIIASNPHYGVNGDYSRASHVNTDKQTIFCELNKPQTKFYSLLYRLKLIKRPRQRLTFNPDFEFMTKKIIEFISSISREK